jgi:DNA-binding LacI/PurR family transcriptional regulator
MPRLYCETENGFENVKLATLNILRKHPEITAIITIFDTAMAGISSAINSLGLKIPEDVAFVGLGDEQGTELTSPSLTVLDFPASFMGYEAARIMINELEKGTRTLKQILVEPKLVIRSSSGLVRNTV